MWLDLVAARNLAVCVASVPPIWGVSDLWQFPGLVNAGQSNRCATRRRARLTSNHVVAGVFSPLELELVVLHHWKQLDRIHPKLDQVRHLNTESTI